MIVKLLTSSLESTERNYNDNIKNISVILLPGIKDSNLVNGYYSPKIWGNIYLLMKSIYQ